VKEKKRMQIESLFRELCLKKRTDYSELILAEQDSWAVYVI